MDEFQYEGEYDANQKFTGFGKLSYASGVVYEGMFEDGQFHGEGTLTLSPDLRYSARFERGVEVERSGSVLFSDGLVFNPTQNLAPAEAAAPDARSGARKIALEWGYLSGSVPGGHDRRLWEEHCAGVRASVQYAQSPAKTQATSGAAEEAARPEAAAALAAAVAAAARQEATAAASAETH